MAFVLQVSNLARLCLGIFASYRPTSIGRCVIHQEQLPMWIGLREDALDRIGKESHGVPDRDDYGHNRLVSHSRLRPTVQTYVFCHETDRSASLPRPGQRFRRAFRTDTG